jgi:hypothetical protein
MRETKSWNNTLNHLISVGLESYGATIITQRSQRLNTARHYSPVKTELIRNALVNCHNTLLVCVICRLRTILELKTKTHLVYQLVTVARHLPQPYLAADSHD